MFGFNRKFFSKFITDSQLKIWMPKKSEVYLGFGSIITGKLDFYSFSFLASATRPGIHEENCYFKT